MKDIFLWEGKFLNTTHKYFCIQYYLSWFVGFNFYQKVEFDGDGIILSLEIFRLFSFKFKWTRRVDHAGISLDLHLLFITFSHGIYDNRHWDDEKDAWETYPEDDVK